MSEEARIAFLEERIKKEQDLARTMSIAAIASIIVTAIGFALYLTPIGALVNQFGLGFIGAIGFVLCYAAEMLANSRKEGFMKEVTRMSINVPTCPKCGKRTPEGNFAFCPYCGSSLPPPP